jgi:hypothetical protein
MNGMVLDTIYGVDVVLRVLLPEEAAQAYTDRIADLTAGSVAPVSTGEELRPVPMK